MRICKMLSVAQEAIPLRCRCPLLDEQLFCEKGFSHIINFVLELYELFSELVVAGILDDL